MNIVHVIATLDARTGGPAMVAARLASAQAALGHRVTLLAAQPQEPDQAEFLPEPSVNLRRFTSESGFAKLLAKQAQGAVLDALREAPGADVLQIHGVWEPALLAASRAAKQAGVPVALCAHGMLDDWALGQKAWKKRLALAVAYGRMVRGSGVVLANNQHEGDCLRARGLGSRVRIVPNGVDLDQPAPAPGSFRAEHPELGEDPYVLFLSRLHRIKGLHILCEAVAQVRERSATGSLGSRLRLVAAGPDAGAAAPLRAQAERLGIASAVHIVGPLYAEAKQGAFHDASIFALASEHESFGIVIAEAMGAGTPVVVSDTCHFPDVAAAGAGRVVMREPGAFAEAFMDLLEDSARAREAGEQGRALVESRYTWGAVARASVEAYEELPPARR